MAEVVPLSVREIQERRFSSLPLDEKREIIKKGRPTPDLIQLKQSCKNGNKVFVRSFQTEWYTKNSWLCGCENKITMFCFPCLLFGGDKTWTVDGSKNLKKFVENGEKHAKSEIHKDNVVSMRLLLLAGAHTMDNHLSNAHKKIIEAHNEKVKNNREILFHIIDCICFCGAFETPLRGHDESRDSENPGVFKGLLKCLSNKLPHLKAHFESSNVFKGDSKTIQNELIDIVLEVYRELVIQEIQQASAVSIMADETTDREEKSQLVIVFRYLVNGTVHERFWFFFELDKQNAHEISQSILQQLEIVLKNDKDKLVAQTYDGANVMKGRHGGVQVKVRDVYRNGHYIHCYCHQTNLVLKNAVQCTSKAKQFLCNILAIPTFFLQSPQRKNMIKKHCQQVPPRPSATRWNYHIRTLRCVNKNVDPLKNCFTEMLSDPAFSLSAQKISGILKHMEDPHFVFWLELYMEIMPHVDFLFKEMQARNITVFKVYQYLDSFKECMINTRNSNFTEHSCKSLMLQAKEVCDNIIADLTVRFSCPVYLIGSKLFRQDQFEEFRQNFPTEEVNHTGTSYPMVDSEELTQEFGIFLKRREMHGYKTLPELLNFILENNLQEVLGAMTLLLKILISIPMTTAEPERCFSTLNRLKTFLRSTMSNPRLNGLAVLSIEKVLINSNDTFKQTVLEKFIEKKNRRMDFKFK